MTDHQPPRGVLGCLGVAVLSAIGALLLLIGLFTVSLLIYNRAVNDEGASFLGVILAALGVALITIAIRLDMARRRTSGG